MKKFFIGFGILLMVCSVFAKPFVPVGKQAVVSVMGNDKISWIGEATGSGGVLDMAYRLRSTKEESYLNMVNYGYTEYLLENAKEIFFDKLRLWGVDLLDEKYVQACPTFVNAVNRKMFQHSYYTCPKNYHLISGNDKQLKDIGEELDLGGRIDLVLKFNKVAPDRDTSGRKMNACVSVTVVFYDRNGKKLKTVTGFSKSDITLKVSGTKSDNERIAAQYPMLIDYALEEAFAQVQKQEMKLKDLQESQESDSANDEGEKVSEDF